MNPFEVEKYSVFFINKINGNERHCVPIYAQHRPAAKSILNGNYYEPETHEIVKKILGGKKRSMIHAGTFFGDMLPSFSLATSGFIYAYEPVLENYILSRLCIERNDLANVILYNAALSDRISNLRINTGQSELQHRGGASCIDRVGDIVPALKIDLFDYDNLWLIHLDVEGHELAALKGGTETIDKHRPILMVEDNLKNCIEFLQVKGYKISKTIPGLTIWTPIEKRISNQTWESM